MGESTLAVAVAAVLGPQKALSALLGSFTLVQVKLPEGRLGHQSIPRSCV